MQLKERNLLLIELTDQLTVTRKQLNKEQKIREHISKHDASVRYTEKGIGAFQKDRRDVVGVGLSIIKMPGLDAGGMGERELSMIGGPHPTLSGANLPGSNVSGTVGETEDDGGFRRIRPMMAGVVRQHRPMSSSSSSSLQQIPSFQDRSLSPPHGHQALNNQSNQSSPPSDIHNSLNVLARRPSTSGGNSVSYSTNLRHELYRKNRAVLSESFDGTSMSHTKMPPLFYSSVIIPCNQTYIVLSLALLSYHLCISLLVARLLIEFLHRQLYHQVVHLQTTPSSYLTIICLPSKHVSSMMLVTKPSFLRIKNEVPTALPLLAPSNA